MKGGAHARRDGLDAAILLRLGEASMKGGAHARRDALAAMIASLDGEPR